jgi:hypothetical protein
MKTRHIFFVILAVFFLSSPLLAHTFYKWVDGKGIVNYADDYNNIPPGYRGRVEIEWVHEEDPIPPIQKMAPQRQEETRRDIYGLGESYWRDKVRPWKEFLNTAEANYDIAHAKEEMLKYADQIDEAKEALGKISKEAEEAKANPEWLK